MLPAVIGIAVLLPLALHRLDGGRRLASLGVAIALLLVAGRVYWNQAVEVRQENRARGALIASLERTAARSDRPIVIADPHYFFELSHYAPPLLAGRLLHLYSREASLRYTGSDSTEEALVVTEQIRAARRSQLRPVRRLGASRSCSSSDPNGSPGSFLRLRPRVVCSDPYPSTDGLRHLRGDVIRALGGRTMPKARVTGSGGFDRLGDDRAPRRARLRRSRDRE